MYLPKELAWDQLASIWQSNCVGEDGRMLLTVSLGDIDTVVGSL